MARRRLTVEEKSEIESLSDAGRDRLIDGLTDALDQLDVHRELIPDASKLTTITTSDPCWTGSEVKVSADDFAGTFVRIQPPHDVDDARIEAVRLAVVACGAEAVVVSPRAKGGSVVLEALTAERSAVGNARQVVLSLVAAANTRNRPALLALVSTFLDKAGV